MSKSYLYGTPVEGWVTPPDEDCVLKDLGIHSVAARSAS